MDFEKVKNIAVVGLSSKCEKPSYRVAEYLKKNGYRVIPVNPMEQEILEEKCYPDLLSIPDDIEIDVVDVFRRSDQVMSVAEQTIAKKAKVLWLQEGVVNEEVKEMVEKVGIKVIMDKCIKKEHRAKQ